MRHVVMVCVTAVICLATAAVSSAQSVYTVTVMLDESTAADDDFLAAAVGNVLDGDAPQQIRKLGAGIIGEAQVLLGNRLQGDDLVLDDGSVVALAEEDEIAIVKVTQKCTDKGCTDHSNGAVILRKGPVTRSRSSSRRATAGAGTFRFQRVAPAGRRSPPARNSAP